MKHLAVCLALLSGCLDAAPDSTDGDQQDSKLKPSATTKVLADAVADAVAAGTPQAKVVGTMVHSCRTKGVSPSIQFQYWVPSNQFPVVGNHDGTLEDGVATGQMVVTANGKRFAVSSQNALALWSGTTYDADDALFVIHRSHFALMVSEEDYAVLNRGIATLEEGEEQVDVACTKAPPGFS